MSEVGKNKMGIPYNFACFHIIIWWRAYCFDRLNEPVWRGYCPFWMSLNFKKKKTKVAFVCIWGTPKLFINMKNFFWRGPYVICIFLKIILKMYSSACTKPWKWAVMYMCVRGYRFCLFLQFWYLIWYLLLLIHWLFI